VTRGGGRRVPLRHPDVGRGLDVTTKVLLREDEVRAIGQAARELGVALEAQIRRWWSFVGKTENNPHDPLAALMALRPELFRFEACDCPRRPRRGASGAGRSPSGAVKAGRASRPGSMSGRRSGSWSGA
jgi:hypothetical protein